MKTNYHTHTDWCDGTDNAEAMIRTALEKGFTALGFSSHVMYPFASDWHMSPRCIPSYVAEIRNLAKKYTDVIDIFLGFEADFFPLLSVPLTETYKPYTPDYIIGSVHYLFNEDKPFSRDRAHCGIPYSCFTVDGSVEEVEGGIKHVFAGDAKKAVQTYFSLQRQMIESCKFDIVGHIDLIRKRNETSHFFCETDPWYKKELVATAESAAKNNKIVEINTGGIARGSMKDSYPSLEFLTMLHDKNVPITINSDAHNSRDLDCAFSHAQEKAKTAGYTEVLYLADGSWETRPLT